MLDRLNYAWRIREDGDFLLVGSYCSAFREARRRKLFNLQLAACDSERSVELFVRPGPTARAAARRCGRLPRAKRKFVEDRNRWGTVITRTELRPRPRAAPRLRMHLYHQRPDDAKYQRKYRPMPNCFDLSWHDTV